MGQYLGLMVALRERTEGHKNIQYHPLGTRTIHSRYTKLLDTPACIISMLGCWHITLGNPFERLPALHTAVTHTYCTATGEINHPDKHFTSPIVSYTQLHISHTRLHFLTCWWIITLTLMKVTFSPEHHQLHQQTLFLCLQWLLTLCGQSCYTNYTSCDSICLQSVWNSFQ